MTALPDWMVRSGVGLTVDDYEALPEEICQQIEIVDGAVVVRPRPDRGHQRVIQQLAKQLECPPGFAVTHNVDLRLRDVPLLNRCPDIAVYEASLPNEVVLRPEHCLLVVEIMSPNSITTDQIHKPTEYAAFGIEHFWRVELGDETHSLYRYRLDPTATPRGYTLVGKDTLTPQTALRPLTATGQYRR